MLKAIQAQESKEAAKEKAEKVIAKLVDMRLHSAAQTLKEGIDELLTYMTFPRNHWTRIRTNNALERMNREIRRRTRVVGNFPDGRSALMLVSA
jgi:transposase-like protein